MGRTERFDIAFGHCRVQDGVLCIERPSLQKLDRWATLRNGLATSFEHRSKFLGLVAGGLLLLLSLFVYLLVDLYLTTPTVAPVVAGLAVLGLLALVVPLERSYRRSTRQRNALQRSLAEEFNLRRPTCISIDDVTGVTVRRVDSELPFQEGHLLLVHYRTDGTEATTYLGIPGFMDHELATATAIFERQGLSVATGDGELVPDNQCGRWLS